MNTAIIGKPRPMHSYKLRIGIDPDTDRNGVALKHADGRLEVELLSFFDLLHLLQTIQATGQPCAIGDVLVRISAGWLNKKTNFRRQIKVKGEWQQAPQGVAERMSEKTGRNHQVGHLIVQMCEFVGVAYETVRPADSKWTPAMFERATGIKTTSQEKIDAGWLVI